jgi:AcrR family transcriptional regulator
MIEIAGRRGFAAVTVRGLTATARVSSRTFYECHASLESCLLSTHALILHELLSKLALARTGAPDAETATRLTIGALVSELAGDPQAARLLLVETGGAGRAAADEAERTRWLIGQHLAESISIGSRGLGLSPTMIGGLAAGVLGVARSRLLEDDLDRLRSPDLVEDLVRWALVFRGASASRLRELDCLAAHHLADADHVASGSSSEAAREEEDVEAPTGDRALLLAAALKLAASGGYRCLTVFDIHTTAGVSRRSFERHFGGAADCFVEAVELRFEAALAQAAAHADGLPSGVCRVYRIVASLGSDFTGAGAFTGIGLTELQTAGARGLACRELLLDRLGELLEAQLISGSSPNPVSVAASASALISGLAARARSERARPERLGALAFIALAPLAESRADDGMHLQPLDRFVGGTTPNSKQPTREGI